MPSSPQGGNFMKLLTKSKLQQSMSQSIATSDVILSRFFSTRRFNFDNDDSGGRYVNNHDHRNNPEPTLNRPLRGERPSSVQNQPRPQRQQSYFQVPNRPRRDDAQSDESFLDKFKLAINNKAGKPPENCATTAQQDQPQEKNTSGDQPAADPPQDADEIFRKMKETGLIPNAVAMLDGLCKDGLVQDAMKLFGLMRERGTIPEVVIYTAVVDGFCKAHKFDDAKRIFRKMQTNGITPNAFSYAVLIQGFCKCNKLEDAVEYCVEMLEAGHSPNVTTFVGLVDGLCRENGVEEARIVIEALKQKGFLVNEKAVREFLDKKAPFSPSIWEAIFGKKTSQKLF